MDNSNEEQIFYNKLQLIEQANKKIFNLKNDNPMHKNIVFVYSQPKVGSTSLVSSIRISASNTFNVIHLHDQSTLKTILGIENVTINEIIRYNAHIGMNVYVIDVYRTPIERKMSVFFENISSFHFNNLEENVNNYDVNRVIKRFNDIYPFLATKDNYIDYFNIPIADVFDYNKKYICQKIDNVTYIKLRLKDSKEWGTILSELLKKEIVIVQDYETNNKKINRLYNIFKSTYKLPINFFNETKNCRLLNYYYSEEERNDYLHNWSQKLTNEYISFNLQLYESYIKISLENQVSNFIQMDHYIDNGCICKCCNSKRNELFNKAKSGQKITEKINHNEIVNTYMDNVKTNIVNNIKTITEKRAEIINNIRNRIRNSNKHIVKKPFLNKKSNKLNNNVMNSLIKNNK